MKPLPRCIQVLVIVARTLSTGSGDHPAGSTHNSFVVGTWRRRLNWFQSVYCIPQDVMHQKKTGQGSSFALMTQNSLPQLSRSSDIKEKRLNTSLLADNPNLMCIAHVICG